MDLTRKARWVKDGHKTPDLTTSNFAGVVSRDSVRIALTYAALNGLQVYAADVRNAYIQAPTSERHYVACGPEFGPYEGRCALIKQALYGRKKAGRDFWLHMRSCMAHLKFKSCKANPDVWMRKAIDPNGNKYWEYILLYTDDVLVISHQAEDVLRNEVGKYFKLKEKSIGPPSQYLGGKLHKVNLENGMEAWAFSSSQYIQEAISNVEKHLNSQNKSLPKKAKSPFTRDYRPECDITEI